MYSFIIQAVLQVELEDKSMLSVREESSKTSSRIDWAALSLRIVTINSRFLEGHAVKPHLDPCCYIQKSKAYNSNQLCMIKNYYTVPCVGGRTPLHVQTAMSLSTQERGVRETPLYFLNADKHFLLRIL